MLAIGRRAGVCRTLQALSAGFTLIELMVVLAILVMAGALFPFVLERTLPHERVVLGSQSVRTALHDEQLRSQNTGELRTVEAETLGKLLPARTHLTVTDLEGTALTAITAYPDGSITASKLDVSEGVQHQIVLTSALTGRLRLQ